jgi:hypothetical protein
MPVLLDCGAELPVRPSSARDYISHDMLHMDPENQPNRGKAKAQCRTSLDVSLSVIYGVGASRDAIVGGLLDIQTGIYQSLVLEHQIPLATSTSYSATFSTVL